MLLMIGDVMNIPKVVLFNTLSEILNDEKVKEDTKTDLTNLFNSEDNEEINRVILKNVYFFSARSLIKYVINEPEFIDACVDLVTNSDNSYLVKSFLYNLEDAGVSKAFFTNEKVFNSLTSNIRLLSVAVHANPEIFNMYDSEKANTLLSLIQSKEDFSLADFCSLPSNNKREMLKQDNIRQRLYQDFSRASYGTIDEEVESILWEEFKEEIAVSSLSQRFRVFDKLSEERKKEAIVTLNIEKDLDNIGSYDFEKIAPYIDQSILMDRVYNTDKKTVSDKYLKNLTSENQIKVLNDLIERKVNVLTSHIFGSLNIDVQERVFDLFVPKLSDYDIYELYKKTNNPKYLEQIKLKILNNEIISINDYLWEDGFVSICSEEERDQIASKLRIISYLSTPPRKMENYNPFFFKIYVDRFIEEVKSNGKNNPTIYFDDFIKYLSVDQQNELLPFLNLDDWLGKILKDEAIFNYILDLLKANPDYFKGKDFSKIEPYLIADENLIKRIDEIINYFDESQLSIFFSDSVLENDENLKAVFKGKALLNPSLVTTTFKLNCFSEEEKDLILNSMDLEALNSLIINASYEKLDLSYILFRRIDEIVDFINNNRNKGVSLAEKIFENSDVAYKKDFIAKINNLYVLNALFSMDTIEESFVDKEIILKRQLELYDADYYNLCLNEMGYINTKIDLSKFSEKDLDFFISTADMKMLVYVSTYYSNDKITAKIIKNMNSDISSLLSDEILPILNNFIFRLDLDKRNEIESILDSYLNQNEFYQSHVKDKAKDVNIKEKVNFLSLFYGKNVSLEKQQLFLNLLDKNPYLLSTLDSVLLSDDMMKMGFHFIDKTSKYVMLQNKLKTALRTNPNIAVFLTQVSSYLTEKEINDSTYDKKISMIIEYLSNSNNKLVDYDFKNIDPTNLSNVIEYILHNYTTVDINIRPNEKDNVVSNHIEDLYEFSIDNFTAERLKKCDEVFNSTNDIDVMKNMYFNKYMSMSLVDAINFYKSYVINYDKVRHLTNSDIPDKFISLITKIINIDDPVTLKELYATTDITYDIGDRFTIESIIQNAYYTSLTNDYQNKQNGTMVNKVYKDKNGSEVELPMTELLDNFGLFVHSTCAYGEMALLDDDYFVSWNNNPRTENHGICCSYITNSSYGTAAVENTGVMFGFTNINENSIATYSPYDLATRNDGYTITSYHTPFYTTLDSIPDFTRHTHNEFDLERRNYSMSQEHSCVQPDCIIIFEDMKEEIKANSIKAYEDFKKHGVELKLIYIDRLKIAENEASKLNQMLTEYSVSYDMKLLADIINLYESNICGCDFLTNMNPDELFMTDSVRKTLANTVNYITQVSDINLRNSLISEFIGVLEQEQYKFDLLDDFNKKRAHTFKLYDDELKKSVEYLRSLQGEQIEKGLVS